MGVYEWTGDLSKPHAARFVPVSLFINGELQDAGLYRSRPVPFALESGDLYTVQRAGQPLGTLDLQTAARIVTGNALAADNPTGAWYGYGTYTADKAPKAPPALHTSAHLGTIESSGKKDPAATKSAAEDDGRPHMTRRTPAAGSGDETSPAPGTAKPDSGGGSTKSAGDDDTDRPTLARRNPKDDASRRRPTGGKSDEASVTAVGPAPGDDPDRPRLTHSTAEEATTGQLTGLPADMHQAVAVSDATSPDPHPYSRPWADAAERATVLEELTAAAKPQVAQYMKRNDLVPTDAPLPADAAPAADVEAPGNAAAGGSPGATAPSSDGTGAPPTLRRGRPQEYGGKPIGVPAHQATKPPAPPSVHSTKPIRPAKPAPAAALALRDPQLEGFTLSYGGLPTFVYSAIATARDTAGKGAGPVAVYVTVVAQRLPSGKLDVALSSVTDSHHLDRGARLRLIDAVDPDDSHRANLLFELRGATSRQFALYRLITTRAENTFTSAAVE